MPDKTGNFAKLVQIYNENAVAAKVSNYGRKLCKSQIRSSTRHKQIRFPLDLENLEK